jgi:hypothetical protein
MLVPGIVEPIGTMLSKVLLRRLATTEHFFRNSQCYAY